MAFIIFHDAFQKKNQNVVTSRLGLDPTSTRAHQKRDSGPSGVLVNNCATWGYANPTPRVLLTVWVPTHDA